MPLSPLGDAIARALTDSGAIPECTAFDLARDIDEFRHIIGPVFAAHDTDARGRSPRLTGHHCTVAQWEWFKRKQARAMARHCKAGRIQLRTQQCRCIECGAHASVNNECAYCDADDPRPAD